MAGADLAARIREEVQREAEELGSACLATILVGDDPASHIYIDRKHAAANEVGIATRDVRLPASASQEEVLALVEELNEDDGVDGMLVQLPLPDHMDETVVTHAVDPVKDVDGFHPVNAGNLYLGTPLHIPATAWGCMELLAEYGVELKGADAVVIGRSEIVGKPMAMLLLAEHATVTICHSWTRDLGDRRIDVASKTFLGAVDADVDDGCAGLDHVGRHEPRTPDRGDHDVGAPGVLAQVARPRVADRDGRVSGE